MGHPLINALTKRMRLDRSADSTRPPEEWDLAEISDGNSGLWLYAHFQSGPVLEHGVNGIGVE